MYRCIVESISMQCTLASGLYGNFSPLQIGGDTKHSLARGKNDTAPPWYSSEKIDKCLLLPRLFKDVLDIKILLILG